MGPQPLDFRYFLTYNSKRTEIVFSPEGWENNSTVSYKRDMGYFGMIRTWGLPLEFVLDGARILRSAYYQDGVEAGVIIEVEELNRSTYKYELGFKGDIDFSKAQDGGIKFTAMLMEAGPTARIKAYENIKYEYELKGDDVVNMKLPGVAFTESCTAIFTPAPSSYRYIPESKIVGNSFQSGFAVSNNTNFQNANDGIFSGSDNWFVEAKRTLTLSIIGDLKCYFAHQFNDRGLRIEIRDNNNAVRATIYNNPDQRGDTYFDFNFNVNIDLVVGNRLFFYFRSNSSSGRIALLEGKFTSSYNSVSDESDCKGIKSGDLFKRIIRRVAPGTKTDSYLLDNYWKNLIFTSGNGIREISDAKIKISLKEFFQTCNSIDDAAMGMEIGVLRLENKSYFFRNAQSVDVGTINDDACVISPAEEFMASRIEAGYDDKNTEDKDGLQEYNSGQEWEMPIARIQNTLDWVSVARADQYGIEKLRVKFNVLNEENNRGTDDTPSDNDTFMVDCHLDGVNYRPILGSSYQVVTGLANDDASRKAYNLNLTPKKNILRHGAYLRSIMDRMDSSYINFASAEKNAKLKTVKDGIGVQENENILVASLPEKYFIPFIASITCKLPIKSRKPFDAVPFGFMKFKWRGVILKGYFLEGSVDIARNTEKEFELLLTQDNNLLNLI